MKNNVFIKNLEGIVRESYAGENEPKYDWNTAIDMYNKKSGITRGMQTSETIRQRSAFLQYVSSRRFDKNGKEIKEG